MAVSHCLTSQGTADWSALSLSLLLYCGYMIVKQPIQAQLFWTLTATPLSQLYTEVQQASMQHAIKGIWQFVYRPKQRTLQHNDGEHSP